MLIAYLCHSSDSYRRREARKLHVDLERRVSHLGNGSMNIQILEPTDQLKHQKVQLFGVGLFL